MIVRIFLAALAAGLIAGLLMTPAQYARLVPLIEQAETYESGGAAYDHGAAPDVDAAVSAGSDSAPASDHHADGHSHDGAGFLHLGRFGNTVLANLVAGGGFALLLAGAALIAGLNFPAGREGVVRGLMLGAAGWFSVQLAPGWGLPPELPGFPYVDLAQRQIWWVSTVALSAVGLYFLVMQPKFAAKILGVALIAAPHLYGAPVPNDISSDVPALLASEYATAALATTLFFWLLLGGLLGFFLSRVDAETVPAEAV
ncbi:CbtA family protein [Pseudohoeflea coraliihabitans]|uniref:CbtA family protein n=1 Tax=Pseudohoeflea coraliihabitans TaxID=2860393 RepID=A0ABS6WIJ4_9HYPH|nr:CbtA family protein [Pseudohoeflea sp. DP4N28-3]MBW3095758.1 CbtA family protein [Pseudohoeflea sp. DP4N28-3]